MEVHQGVVAKDKGFYYSYFTGLAYFSSSAERKKGQDRILFIVTFKELTTEPATIKQDKFWLILFPAAFIFIDNAGDDDNYNQQK
ncbi:MAG: hypothetical protein JSS70_04520 [Bacteroidetes bacterium]|nr:hypothetical protein [Bacteroidota bacterium]